MDYIVGVNDSLPSSVDTHACFMDTRWQRRDSEGHGWHRAFRGRHGGYASSQQQSCNWITSNQKLSSGSSVVLMFWSTVLDPTSHTRSQTRHVSQSYTGQTGFREAQIPIPSPFGSRIWRPWEILFPKCEKTLGRLWMTTVQNFMPTGCSAGEKPLTGQTDSQTNSKLYTHLILY